MQDFLVENIKMVYNIYNKKKAINNFSIEKTFNLGGIIELMLRTFIPMSIFETLVNKKKIDIFNFNTEEFRQFAKDDISSDIKSSMHNISTWLLKYKHTYNNDDRLIGVEINSAKKNEYEKYSILADRTSFDDSQRYYISPLKYFAFLSEYFDDCRNREQLLKFYNDVYRIENFNDSYDFLHDDCKRLNFINSNIGILSIVKFSKKLSKNILEVSFHYSKKEDLQTDGKEEKSSKNNYKYLIGFEDYYKRFIDKKIANYKIQFFHHLLIFIYKNTTHFFNDMNLNEDLVFVGSSKEDLKKYKNQDNPLIRNINIINQYKDNSKEYKYLKKYIDILQEEIIKDKSYRNSFYVQTHSLYNEKFAFLEPILDTYLYTSLKNKLKSSNDKTRKEFYRQINYFFTYLNLNKNKNDKVIGMHIKNYFMKQLIVKNKSNINWTQNTKKENIISYRNWLNVFLASHEAEVDLVKFIEFLKDPENATK